jgi:hypothetical protein
LRAGHVPSAGSVAAQKCVRRAKRTAVPLALATYDTSGPERCSSATAGEFGEGTGKSRAPLCSCSMTAEKRLPTWTVTTRAVRGRIPAQLPTAIILLPTVNAYAGPHIVTGATPLDVALDEAAWLTATNITSDTVTAATRSRLDISVARYAGLGSTAPLDPGTCASLAAPASGPDGETFVTRQSHPPDRADADEPAWGLDGRVAGRST